MNERLVALVDWQRLPADAELKHVKTANVNLVQTHVLARGVLRAFALLRPQASRERGVFQMYQLSKRHKAIALASSVNDFLLLG